MVQKSSTIFRVNFFEDNSTSAKGCWNFTSNILARFLAINSKTWAALVILLWPFPIFVVIMTISKLNQQYIFAWRSQNFKFQTEITSKHEPHQRHSPKCFFTGDLFLKKPLLAGFKYLLFEFILCHVLFSHLLKKVQYDAQSLNLLSLEEGCFVSLSLNKISRTAWSCFWKFVSSQEKLS